MLYPPCAGGTVAQRGHTLRSYSQPVDPNCFPSPMRSFRQSQVVPPSNNLGPVIKNQIRHLP